VLTDEEIAARRAVLKSDDPDKLYSGEEQEYLEALQQTRQDLRKLCEKVSSPVAWDMEKTQMADELKKKYGWEG